VLFEYELRPELLLLEESDFDVFDPFGIIMLLVIFCGELVKDGERTTNNMPHLC